MVKNLTETDKFIKRSNEKARKELNNIISEYVSLYNRLEADSVNPVLNDEQIEDMEEQMRSYERMFIGLFISSQGYSIEYDEEKHISQYVKTGRAKDLL